MEAKQIDIHEIEKWLDAFQSGTGKFRQIDSNGKVSEGKIYISKPGKVRFEYFSPQKSVVVLNGQFAKVYDPMSNARPRTYNVKEHPIVWLLSPSFNLRSETLRLRAKLKDRVTQLEIKSRGEGNRSFLKLSFLSNPTRLVGWSFGDVEKNVTVVILYDFKLRIYLDTELFD